jgi:hypothetical protein
MRQLLRIITRWWALGLCLLGIAYVAFVISEGVREIQRNEERIASYCGETKLGAPLEQAAQRAIDSKLTVRRYGARQWWEVTSTSFYVETTDGRGGSICSIEHDGQSVLWVRLQHRAFGGDAEQIVSYCKESKAGEPVEQAAQRAIDRKLALRQYERSRQVAGRRKRWSSAGWSVWAPGGWVGSFCSVKHDGQRVTQVSFNLWYQ